MNPKLEILRQKANNLTLDPGVYIMLDAEGTVIYVGKAKHLKNRVSSYFHGDHLPKVSAMIDKIDDFNIIIVKSEFEALILENSLIKKYQPHYNILLKDDKGYPFIRINMNDAYPKMSIVGKCEKDGAEYYGPFGGRDITRQLISAINMALLLPDCSRRFPEDIGKGRPCLNFQMKCCEGWCLRDKDREEYKKRIEQARLILDGKKDELISNLESKMLAAAEEQRFEYAAKLRDRIRSIEALGNTQRVTVKNSSRYFVRQETEDNEAVIQKGKKTLALLQSMLGMQSFPHRIEAYDISNLGNTGIVASMTVFVDGKPYKRDYRKFRMKSVLEQDDYASMRETVTRRFKRYLDGDEKFSSLPDLIIIDGGQEHALIARQVLNELNISTPVFGAVKDDRHRTRALVSPDGGEIGISGKQPVFVLIGRIQEETHRFAIEFQRSLRYENYGSALDGIEGIGPKRKTELFRKFKTVKAIKNAGIAELEEVLPTNVAKEVYNHFNGEKQA